MHRSYGPCPAQADAKANAAASATAALANEPVVVANPPVDTSPTGWAEPPPDRPPLTAEQEAENERLRPLDRFLLPLQVNGVGEEEEEEAQTTGHLWSDSVGRVEPVV